MKDAEKKQLAENNKDIPTSEIEQDILDTEGEIFQMTEEAEHLEKTPLSLQSARWDHIRASSRRQGIKERKEFIEKLSNILEGRKLLSPKEKEEGGG